MKLIMSNLSKSSFGWFAGMISLVVLIAFSSCSTNREASLAYMDDIYKPYDINYLVAALDDENDVSDQDASVIKPYRPTVPDYSPYVKPINFNMSFGYGNFYPFYGRGYGNYRKPYGYYPRYYCYGTYGYGTNGYNGYNCFDSPYSINPYMTPSYGYYPNNYGYGNDYSSPPGGSYVYGNNIGFFHGINSSERFNGTGVNYSKYVYYRASGSSGVVNTGRQSGSSGKSRYVTNSSSGKSNTNKSNNYNKSSNFNSSRSYQSSPSGRSSSPSRSSGSGGGSYTGKRPR